MFRKNLFKKKKDSNDNDDINAETSDVIKCKKKIYLKWIIAVICFGIVIAVVLLFNDNPKTSVTGNANCNSNDSLYENLDSSLNDSLDINSDSNSDSNEVIDTDNQETCVHDFTGFQVYNVSDFKNANPWNEDIAITQLPIMKNKINNNDVTGSEKPDYKLMESILKQTAQDLGMNTKNLSKTDYMFIDDQNYKVAINSNCIITVDFKTPVKLPSQYNFKFNATYEELQKVAEFLKKEYASLIGMKNPIINIHGGYYNSDGEQYYTLAFFEKGNDIKESILNYNFNEIEFISNENGQLFCVHKNHTDLSDVVGNYPIINTDEALNLLVKGNYYTFDLYKDYSIKKEYVKKVELEYVSHNKQLIMPFYKFYIEKPDSKLENGMKTYGEFFVPATEGKYIENMPIWEDKID